MDDIIEQQEINKPRPRRKRRRGRIPRLLNMKRPEKKMTGAGFYMIVMLAVAKDLGDFLFSFTGVFSFLGTIFAVIVTFTISFYMFYIGVSFGTKKVAVVAVVTLIEIIPFLNILPTYPFILFIIRHLENKKQEEKYKRKLKMLKFS